MGDVGSPTGDEGEKCGGMGGKGRHPISLSPLCARVTHAAALLPPRPGHLTAYRAPAVASDCASAGVPPH
jgi:hypothetical protein